MSVQFAPDRLDQLVQKLWANSYTSKGPDLRTGFKRLDADRDGVLTWEEFRRVMRRQRVSLRPNDVATLFHHMDVNQSGCVEYEDFKAYMQTQQPKRNFKSTKTARWRRQRKRSSVRCAEGARVHELRTPRLLDGDFDWVRKGGPLCADEASQEGHRLWQLYLSQLALVVAPVLHPESLLKLLSKLEASTYTKRGPDLFAGFRRFDADRDGRLDWREFQRIMRKQGVKVGILGVQVLFELMDVDRSGSVEEHDFAVFMEQLQVHREELLHCVQSATSRQRETWCHGAVGPSSRGNTRAHTGTRARTQRKQQSIKHKLRTIGASRVAAKERRRRAADATNAASRREWSELANGLHDQAGYGVGSPPTHRAWAVPEKHHASRHIHRRTRSETGTVGSMTPTKARKPRTATEAMTGTRTRTSASRLSTRTTPRTKSRTTRRTKTRLKSPKTKKTKTRTKTKTKTKAKTNTNQTNVKINADWKNLAKKTSDKQSPEVSGVRQPCSASRPVPHRQRDESEKRNGQERGQDNTKNHTENHTDSASRNDGGHGGDDAGTALANMYGEAVADAYLEAWSEAENEFREVFESESAAESDHCSGDEYGDADDSDDGDSDDDRGYDDANNYITDSIDIEEDGNNSESREKNGTSRASGIGDDWLEAYAHRHGGMEQSARLVRVKPHAGEARRVQRARQLRRLLDKLTASMYTAKGRDPAIGFRRLDADRDGRLDWPEFRRVMRKQGIKMEHGAVVELFYSMDVNKSGSVELEDFTTFMNSHWQERQEYHHRYRESKSRVSKTRRPSARFIAAEAAATTATAPATVQRKYRRDSDRRHSESRRASPRSRTQSPQDRAWPTQPQRGLSTDGDDDSDSSVWDSEPELAAEPDSEHETDVTFEEAMSSEAFSPAENSETGDDTASMFSESESAYSTDLSASDGETTETEASPCTVVSDVDLVDDVNLSTSADTDATPEDETRDQFDDDPLLGLNLLCDSPRNRDGVRNLLVTTEQEIDVAHLTSANLSTQETFPSTSQGPTCSLCGHSSPSLILERNDNLETRSANTNDSRTANGANNNDQSETTLGPLCQRCFTRQLQDRQRTPSEEMRDMIRDKFQIAMRTLDSRLSTAAGKKLLTREARKKFHNSQARARQAMLTGVKIAITQQCRSTLKGKHLPVRVPLLPLTRKLADTTAR